MLFAAAIQDTLGEGRGGGARDGVTFRLNKVAYRTMRDSFLQLSHLLLAQLHIEGCNVLLQVLDALGPRDGEDIIPLLLHPGQCQLPRLTPLLVCQHFDLLHQLLILHNSNLTSSDAA